jgi:hypothetical protein
MIDKEIKQLINRECLSISVNIRPPIFSICFLNRKHRIQPCYLVKTYLGCRSLEITSFQSSLYMHINAYTVFLNI